MPVKYPSELSSGKLNSTSKKENNNTNKKNWHSSNTQIPSKEIFLFITYILNTDTKEGDIPESLARDRVTDRIRRGSTSNTRCLEKERIDLVLSTLKLPSVAPRASLPFRQVLQALTALL